MQSVTCCDVDGDGQLRFQEKFNADQIKGVKSAGLIVVDEQVEIAGSGCGVSRRRAEHKKRCGTHAANGFGLLP
ncbi:hypothetical protein D3C87_2180580 [compost metagenome]